MRSISPLRYPGGKAFLYNDFLAILKANDLLQRPYVEPYSGGCGLGLGLLMNGAMSRLHINDVDRSIWAFWHSVLYSTEKMVDRITETPVSLAEWKIQREIQFRKEDCDVLDLGFSTFFLNRTNRSGVIHSGGAIGGVAQSGNYKIDCRFNKSDLIRRIARISKYRGRIELTRLDGNELMSGLSDRSVLYVDPPYYDKGSTLYMNAYSKRDHSVLASTLRMSKTPWILTYDDVPGIRELYKNENCYSIDVSYSVQTKRIGKELLILHESLKAPGHMSKLN